MVESIDSYSYASMVLAPYYFLTSFAVYLHKHFILCFEIFSARWSKHRGFFYGFHDTSSLRSSFSSILMKKSEELTITI